jgi:hypothetical protein
MSAFLWRCILAVVCFLLAINVLPLLFRVLGFEVSGEAWQLVRICLGGIAVIYAIFGKGPNPPWVTA